MVSQLDLSNEGLVKILIWVALSATQLGCSNAPERSDLEAATREDSSSEQPQRPEGWTETSHGPDAPPDYETVFNQDEVNQFDIEIDPSDWQAMMDDMTEMFGEFGQGPRFGANADGDGRAFEIPQQVIDACLGKEDNDRCSFILEEIGESSGSCRTLPFLSETICLPDDFMNNMPGGNREGMGSMFSDRNPIWVPCTVHFQEQTWFYVGIRFKGQSTLSSSWGGGTYKLPLKFDFDEFETQYPEVTDQRFFGFKRLSLASNAMDSSYLRDKIAGDLFREGGVPAPRRAFYRVFIDLGDGPVYYGLYTVAEVPARPMILNQYRETGGNLYKPTWGAANWNAGLPIDEDSFSKKTNIEQANWSDVENAINALHAPREDAEKWRDNLEKFFNADRFMHWLAINTVIQDWDTYGRMAQNYYLYGDPAQQGQLNWIPWDHNLSLSGSSTMPGTMTLPLDMSTVDDNWPLIRFLYDDPVYQKAYWGYVAEFTETLFTEDQMRQRFQFHHDLIAPDIIGPEGERENYTTLSDPEDFDNSLEQLFTHVASRQQAVAEALAARR